MGRPRNPAREPRKPKKTAKSRAMGAVAQAAIAKMWDEIREKFETTPASIRDLAREYGVKSHTTVLRRVQQEGWTKQPAPIAAHIATENIISEVLEAERVQEITPPAPAPGHALPPAQINPPSEPKFDHKSTANNVGKTSEIVLNGDQSRPAKTGGREAAAEQRSTVKAAERMALVQQRQALLEIKLADQAIAISAKVLTALQEVMETDDLQSAQLLINRFGAIGDETESFSGLMRTAIMGIEKGVTLRRRAIGMDLRTARGTSTDAMPISSADLPEQVREMLPTLSTEELLELRKAAVVMGKKLELAAPTEARNTIEGLAEAILDGEG